MAEDSIPKTRVSVAQVCEALATARGNIAVAAASLGVSRRTVERRIERHESCRQARDDARQQTTDIVEGRLEERAINGDPWAVTFYLSTRARDRGYGNRTELTGPNGGPQQHEVRSTVSMSDKTDEELDEIIARATLNGDNSASKA